MSTGVLLEEGKDRRDRRIRNGSAELPGFCISTKIDQSLPAVAETLPARNCYEGHGGKTFVMFHGTSRENWRSIEQGGFTPSREGGLGAGVYVTRNEQKAAWYSGKHFTNGVIIKLKVALGRYVEINKQGHPLQMTWMKHGYDSAFAPAGAIGVREENCIADPSRIEIIGLQRGYKAPCHYGQSCTRKDRGCKFDHGRGDDNAQNERGKRRKRKSPSTKRLAAERQRRWHQSSWKTGE